MVLVLAGMIALMIVMESNYARILFLNSLGAGSINDLHLFSCFAPSRILIARACILGGLCDRWKPELTHHRRTQKVKNIGNLRMQT